eukprot:4437530-Prymnesium_polylepis.2
MCDIGDFRTFTGAASPRPERENRETCVYPAVSACACRTKKHCGCFRRLRFYEIPHLSCNQSSGLHSAQWTVPAPVLQPGARGEGEVALRPGERAMLLFIPVWASAWVALVQPGGQGTVAVNSSHHIAVSAGERPYEVRWALACSGGSFLVGGAPLFGSVKASAGAIPSVTRAVIHA